MLDLGSSDGETLRHFAELRPDLHFFSVDWEDKSAGYPKGCQFFRGDLQKDVLPWPSASMDGITCMQLVEHLTTLEHVFREVARLLKPGGKVYFETPHPKTVLYSSPQGPAAGTFTMNFYDDITHTRPVPVGAMGRHGREVGLTMVRSGISRNWLFAASTLAFVFCRPSRQKYTAWGHLRGWSAYLIAQKSP